MNKPEVGVCVLVLRRDEVLLQKRDNVIGAGTWVAPGGHIEAGESFEACGRREACEETGVEIGELRFRAVTNDILEEDDKHYVTIWFEADHVAGEPRVRAEYEMSEVGWFRWDALPEPLFQPLRNLLEGRTYPETRSG